MTGNSGNTTIRATIHGVSAFKKPGRTISSHQKCVNIANQIPIEIYVLWCYSLITVKIGLKFAPVRRGNVWC